MYHSKIQYISQGKTKTEQLYNIQQVLDAGGNWIQLRFKNATEQELLSLAQEVSILCKIYHATCIINDHVQLAHLVDADGVHLGLNDMSVLSARKILGVEKIIGGTANTIKDVLKRVDEACDYIGLGPFRFTTTKEKLSPALGLTGYSTILSEVRKKEIDTPIYAIGGIVLEDVPALIQTGVYGIAASGMLTNHTNKKELLKKLKINIYGPAEYSR